MTLVLQSVFERTGCGCKQKHAAVHRLLEFIFFFFYREPRQATNEKCYKNLKKRKRKKDTIIQTRHIRKLYTNQCAGCNFLHYKCFSSHINIDTFYVLLCTNSHCCTRVCLFAERKTCNHGVLLVQNWKNKNKHCAFIPNTKDHETMKKIIMHKG